MNPSYSALPGRLTGSAMVEFVLLLGVLLPVGLGVAMLGKLADLTHTTEQASRYATWEATVYSRDALASRSAAVEARFYGRADTMITSDVGTAGNQPEEVQGNGTQIAVTQGDNTQGDATQGDATQGDATQGDASQGVNSLWGKPAGKPGTMRRLASVSRSAQQQVVPEYNFDTGSAPLSKISGEAVAIIGSPLSGFSGNSWGLTGDGLLRSNIDVAVEPTRLLPGSQAHCGSGSIDEQENAARQVCVRSAGVILADGWAAADDAHAASRVRSLVPASTMNYVGKALSAVLGSLLFPELDPLDEAFGYVDMDVLPEYAKP